MILVFLLGCFETAAVLFCRFIILRDCKQLPDWLPLWFKARGRCLKFGKVYRLRLKDFGREEPHQHWLQVWSSILCTAGKPLSAFRRRSTQSPRSGRAGKSFSCTLGAFLGCTTSWTSCSRSLPGPGSLTASRSSEQLASFAEQDTNVLCL